MRAESLQADLKVRLRPLEKFSQLKLRLQRRQGGDF
jgi:hypothetical protein